MKSISKIIVEEVRGFVMENNEADYEYYSAFDRIKEEVVDDFLYKNNDTMSKEVAWRVVPFSRLKKVWEDYMKYGFVRDEKSLDYIERIIIRNVLLIDVFTNFSGHVDTREYDDYLEEEIREFVDQQLDCYFRKPVDTRQYEIDFETGGSEQPTPQASCDVHPHVKDFIEDNYNPDTMNYEDLEKMLYDEIIERFMWDYLAEGYITDYGLKPLRNLATQLYSEIDPKEKLVTIDKILNVVHQTSDLAAWFIQGGASALSDLSGYNVPEDETDPYSDEVSKISGKYRMHDYS
jgi:hypothetical protein